MTGSERSRHQEAAETFATRVRERFGDAVDAVFLYGSVARGEETGLDSDVDLLILLEEATEPGLEQRIRELAYEIELDHGVVLSLVVTSSSEFRSGTPFFRQVQSDAERLYG